MNREWATDWSPIAFYVEEFCTENEYCRFRRNVLIFKF
jgi:hypothetical protein